MQEAIVQGLVKGIAIVLNATSVISLAVSVRTLLDLKRRARARDLLSKRKTMALWHNCAQDGRVWDVTYIHEQLSKVCPYESAGCMDVTGDTAIYVEMTIELWEVVKMYYAHGDDGYAAMELSDFVRLVYIDG